MQALTLRGLIGALVGRSVIGQWTEERLINQLDQAA